MPERKKLNRPLLSLNDSDNDSVTGVLYDLLQKEVITLRKAAHEKDQSMRDKDEAIEVAFTAFKYNVMW